MAQFNIPGYTADNFSFGPGVLFVGPVGATPTVDVGAVKAGAELAVTREILEMRQGSTQNLVKQYVTQENVSLKVSGVEWNLARLKEVLGSGVLTTSSDVDTIEFGGDVDAAELAVRFRHVLPIGHTLYVDLWKTQPAPELSITFGEEFHEFPYNFKALDSTTKWDGSATDSNGRLMRIIRQKV